MLPKSGLKQNLKLDKEFLMRLQNQPSQGMIDRLTPQSSSHSDTLKYIHIALTPSGLKATMSNQNCCKKSCREV